MTSRLQLRMTLRRHLSDTGTSPLWPEEFLNDAIAEAIRRYGVPIPRQAIAAVSVTAGDREIDLPENVNAMRIVTVFDDSGTPWRRWEGGTAPPPVPVGHPNGSSPAGAIWRAWGTAVILGSPAPRTGLWRLEHLANRVEPFDDISDLDIQPGDDDLILTLAISVSLHRRAIAEGKRYTGRAGVHPLAAAARTAQTDADRLFWHRLRHLRTGTLTNTLG
jgi:hypothetical protein